LRFATWRAKWDWAVGIAGTLAVVGLLGCLYHWDRLPGWPYWLYCLIAGIAAAWTPRVWRVLKWYWKARRIVHQTSALNHNTNLLRRVLMNFTGGQIVGQPLPDQQRTDDRYELLTKLQGVLRSLRFHGLLVLVDRVDEPYLINGSTELMRALIWPVLDNKFLKHPGMGLKLLLPIELERLIDREDRDFHQRARLDKQNLIRSLEWTGQSLYDVANARIKGCALEGSSPVLADLFDQSIDEKRLMDAFAALRVPRHLFKFMYRLFTTHCNAHSDEAPVWRISSGTFESVLALYQRDQDAFDRGVGAG
jgi:hypothetical protein